jgi:hypothetical protein
MSPLLAYLDSVIDATDPIPFREWVPVLESAVTRYNAANRTEHDPYESVRDFMGELYPK